MPFSFYILLVKNLVKNSQLAKNFHQNAKSKGKNFKKFANWLKKRTNWLKIFTFLTALKPSIHAGFSKNWLKVVKFFNFNVKKKLIK